MIVGIRPDWCIALRMIALHEYYRQQSEFLESCGIMLDVRRVLNEQGA